MEQITANISKGMNQLNGKYQDLQPFLELAEVEAVTLVVEVTAVEDLTHVEDGEDLFKTMM